MPGNVDRGGRNDTRQRRALQKLAANALKNLGITSGDGIIVDETEGTISIDLADANSGLVLLPSGLSILLDTNPGLVLGAAGLKILIDPAAHNLSALSVTGLMTRSPLTAKGDIYVWSSLDTRLPVGSDGQVLIADSTQATGLKWAAAAAASPLTTKGDLYTYDTGNQRLAVGTDGFILTADSSAATGIKWAAATGAASPLTTKGDLYTYDTVNQRLAVGADGLVLTADSSQATGIKWQAVTPSTYITVTGSSPNETVTLNTGNGATSVVQLSQPRASGGYIRFSTNLIQAGLNITPGNTVYIGIAANTMTLDTQATAATGFKVQAGGSNIGISFTNTTCTVSGWGTSLTLQPLASAANTTGRQISVLGGAASTGTADGGKVAITGGTAAATSGVGGSVTITGGTSVGTNGGGVITIQTGDGIGSNQSGGQLLIKGGKPTGSGDSPILIQIQDNAGTAHTAIQAAVTASGTTAKLGFLGATPIARPGVYTITAAPAVSTALNADANAGANYTSTPVALLNASTLTDLNDLRADVQSLAAVLRQLIKHLGDTAGLGLVDETSY